MEKEKIHSLILQTIQNTSGNGSALQNWPPLILFDGDCGFCNQSIQWISQLDKKGILYYIRANSKLGKAILAFFDPPEKAEDTVFFVAEGKIYWKSEAILQILYWVEFGFAIGLRYVPLFIRDFFYDTVAKYRYLLSNNSPACNLAYVASFEQRLLE
jgi:predicted DCC family thiol-disulfide oxidoreductase YuxK